MQKAERQNTIKNIISSKPINRQEELVRLLRRNGHNVTQASVSRDLDELGIVKIGGHYCLPSRDEHRSAFGKLSFDTAGDVIIVMRCDPGYASAAASRIDHSSIADVVGTIAGDDTIFIAIKSSDAQKNVLRSLIALFTE
jgi:transcriptional regulator of arginine metabolism